MPELKVSNFSRFFALLLLYEKPRHGYELLKEVGHRLGQRQSAGQVYPFLRTLQRRHYVSVEQTGNRRKKVFELTPEGRKFVRSLLEKFDTLLEASVRSHLRTCSHCKCTLYESGIRKRINGKTRFFCCENCARAIQHSKQEIQHAARHKERVS
ncbi:PadR family transcriptional regulator [Candidatus Micrarchaeota archaeon]|nr:PadR family transcriptional regulator [Candidatus Micrarchaeota archaeon]